MPEIFSPHNQLARPLFRELERSHALVTAFFEGCVTARLFVDDMTAPKTGVIVCNSRVLCAGDVSQADFLDEMARTFSDELIPAHRSRENDVYLVYTSGDIWNTALQPMFTNCKMYHGTRQYY